MKNVAYAVVNFVLFLVTVYLSSPIWFLFLILTVYYGYRGAVKPKPVRRPDSDPKAASGVLGEYAVDGESSDLSYGLFLNLRGRQVFVEVKEDGLVEARRRRAIELFQQSARLEQSLATFMDRNEEFREKYIGSIGLHAKDPDQGEVFWEPEGYTLLRGLEFCDAAQA